MNHYNAQYFQIILSENKAAAIDTTIRQDLTLQTLRTEPALQPPPHKTGTLQPFLELARFGRPRRRVEPHSGVQVNVYDDRRWGRRRPSACASAVCFPTRGKSDLERRSRKRRRIGVIRPIKPVRLGRRASRRPVCQLRHRRRNSNDRGRRRSWW